LRPATPSEFVAKLEVYPGTTRKAWLGGDAGGVPGSVPHAGVPCLSNHLHTFYLSQPCSNEPWLSNFPAVASEFKRANVFKCPKALQFKRPNLQPCSCYSGSCISRATGSTTSKCSNRSSHSSRHNADSSLPGAYSTTSPTLLAAGATPLSTVFSGAYVQNIA